MDDAGELRLDATRRSDDERHLRSRRSLARERRARPLKEQDPKGPGTDGTVYR